MTSKRTLKRDVEDLSEMAHGDGEPIVMDLTGRGSDDDQHKALLTSSFPDHSPERETVAIPKLKPRRWWPENGFLFVGSCDEHEKYGIDADSDDDNAVFACDLWDDMTDEELAAEAEYRVENDEPLPDLLEPYTSE